MWQRVFLNLVVHEHHTSRYALHRIRLSKNLFYEATENATAQEVARAQEAAKAKKKNGGWPFLSFRRLPRPEIFFSAHTRPRSSHFFSLLPAQGEGCVMFADHSGNVSLYDVDTQSVVAMPQAKFGKPANSITLSVAKTNRRCDHQRATRGDHDLYVMSTMDGSFEVLNYCRTDLSYYHSAFRDDWNWQPLGHVPPFVEYRYNIHCHVHDASVSPPLAAAVVDSSTICTSSKEGTYALDMSRGVWTQAGRWTLPFHGAAEYVPEFRLWFALQGPKNSPQHRLCALDLSSAAMAAEEAPAPLNAWDYLDCLPDGWYPSKRYLVNLGLGKFCIATRCFHRPSREEEHDVKKVKGASNELTVFTGVEVVREGDGLQMIKHKSRHYSNNENLEIHCVL